MPKRYYWLKLKEDFFDEDTIEWLEEQENGLEYSHFYLKLCLKSLRTNGELIRSVGNVFIPYDAKKLSEITKTDIDTVKVAMDIFKKIGLIDILDGGVIKLNQLGELVGSETDKAGMMRRKRTADQEGNKLEHIGNNVTGMLPHIELEIDKEIDIEKEKEKIEEIKIEYSEKVFLTEKQFNILIYDYGKIITISAIEILSNYKCSKNKKYESDYHALLTWAIKEAGGKDRQLIKAEVAKRRSDNEAQKKVMNEIKEGKLEKRMSPAELSELTKGITEKSNFLNGGAKQQEEPPWGVKE
ncbi:hypothetical protein LCGC14_1883340 [marine sediment metagenome]|uniref:Phage replisome organiser N-terminal domain-containing protein n=1 Tax=marine sediment metagenome TaxID=412755 RepID=A0A0F9GPX5_9ZZZZ